MPRFTKRITALFLLAGLALSTLAVVAAAPPDNSRANQPITCRAGNICTYPDGTVLPSKTKRRQSSAPTSSSARVIPSSPPVYVLDGQTYTRDALISDFIRMAFPSHLWFDADVEARNHFKSPVITSDPEAGSKSWAREYIQRTEGLPRFDGLNRWKGDVVTVSFDWPPGVWHTGNASAYKPLAEQITKLAPQIEAATGLKIKLLYPAEEKPETFARVRIVTAVSYGPANRFKNSLRRSGGAVGSAMVLPMAERPMFEDSLFGTVAFTPFSPAQVEGYLIPDKDNNIDMAVCKIAAPHNTHLQQALVTECLARALGLPEDSLTNDDAVLGRWNKAHEPHSFLSFQEEEARVRRNELESFPHDLTDFKKAKRSLTEYDRAMLTLLYCPALKPGMGRYEVLRALYHADACFQSFQQTQ